MELRVMIVDDDNIFNLIAKVLLQDTAIVSDPVICTNGEEALRYLKQALAPDRAFLIFLDINMPIMNGWDVLDRLQQCAHSAAIFVVIVTSSINKADKERALGYPQIIDYLIKPLKKDRLLTLKSSSHLAAFFSN